MSPLQPAIAAHIAARAHTVLDTTFAILGMRWANEKLREVHATEQARLIEYFQAHLGFARSVLDFQAKCLSRLHTEDTIELPTTLSNFMSLLSQVIPEYSDALAEPRRSTARQAARELLERVTANYLDGVAPQVRGLAELLRRADHLLGRISPKGRIILLELPVGNSIPVKLLERHLRAGGKPIEVIRIALSRNDTKRIGVTREQLIKAVLAETSLIPDDVLLHADEWSTGANFGKISKIVSKAVRARGVRFIPIGLMAPHSRQHSKFDVHRKNHDEFAADAGLSGESCRIDFDELNLGAAEPVPFFWAEHDRKAGYRKMQLLGSIFSSLDDMIERLAADRSARTRAYSYILESGGLLQKRLSLTRMVRATWARAVHRIHRAAQPLPSWMFKYVERLARRATPQETALVYMLEREFHEGLRAYRHRRTDIMRIVHSSNTTAVDDIEDAIRELAARIEQAVGDTSAERCMAIAVYFARYEGAIDPENRYYFDEHVPLISELQGDARMLHEILMNQLADRVGRFSTGDEA